MDIRNKHKILRQGQQTLGFVILLTISNFIPLFSQTGNTSVPQTRSAYDLSKPDQVLILPPQLHEISGITVVDPQTLACIQDENGIIFFYDVQKKAISRSLGFLGNGDYEDIARVGNEYYVLRSDRFIFQTSISGNSTSVKTISLSAIPYKNLEGLCFDSRNNLLLIIPKDGGDKDKTDKSNHPVYGYDLTNRQLMKNPVFIFDVKAVKKFVADNKIVVSKSKDGNKYDFSFSPSALAINPVNNKVYVLSGSELLLFVFDTRGTIESVIPLGQDLFTQPEGIAFERNGDMLISNEGQKKNPTILRFRYLTR